MLTFYLYDLQPGDLYYDPALNWTLDRTRLLNLLQTKIPAGYNGLSLGGGDGSNTYFLSQKELGKVKINDKGLTGTDRIVFRPDVAGLGKASLSNAKFSFTLTSDFVGIEEIVLDNNGVWGMEFNGSSSPRSLKVLGSAGHDSIVGTVYGDYLDGGASVDTLNGGKGDDIYVVTLGDRVIEWYGSGIDTVKAYCSWTLGEYLENLELIGSENTSGKGNDQQNVIKGNVGDNILDGCGGIVGYKSEDVLMGGKGNDAYYVRGAFDTVVENSGEGRDTIFATVNYTLSDNVENGVLIGNCQTLRGNALDNYIRDDRYSDSVIIGNAGNDRIAGGKGCDILTGGSGADVFEVGVGDAIIGSGYDKFERITDFEAGVDIIDIPGNTLRPVALAWSQARSLSSDFSSSFFARQFIKTKGLPANGACAVTMGFGSVTRTFIAIDTNSNGFDVRDNVIEITGYTGSLSNITVI
jgi:Ca2+-binding RTX toxin-like protein